MVQPRVSVSIANVILVKRRRGGFCFFMCSRFLVLASDNWSGTLVGVRRLIPSGCFLLWAYLLEPKKPQGIAIFRDDDQASPSATAGREWKVGIDGRRTHV